MEKSDLFKVNLRDVANGLLVAVISAVLVYLQQLLSSKGLQITLDDAKTILTIALTSGIGYIVKNFFEKKDGESVILGKVTKFPK